MTERVNITDAEVHKILALQEDYYVDFKAREKSPGSLSKWVSAFSNSSGGDIYVGIDEPERGRFSWRGFDRIEDANSLLGTLTPLYPQGDDIRYVFLEAPGYKGSVLRIEVGKSRDIKKSSDGTVYRRAGASIQRVETEEDMSVLRLQKGITSHEASTFDAPLDLVSDSLQVIDFLINVVPSVEAEPWLRKQLLIREGKPTVASIVLFADEPQVVLPKASVIVYRYATTAQKGSREFLAGGKTHNVEGSAYAQISAAVRLTTSLIEEIRTPSLEEVKYPNETLHEIITNSVIHRDYSAGDNVHVRIFDDRVEVESPGQLPGHVTPRNILEARFSRNQQIERWLHKFPDPPNKNVGEGLQTAFAAMKKMRLKSPEIRELANSVLVTISHERLDSPGTLVVDYLKAHDTITNREGREITGLQRDHEMRRVFVRLVAQEEIERVPGTIKGGAKYRLKSGK